MNEQVNRDKELEIFWKTERKEGHVSELKTTLDSDLSLTRVVKVEKDEKGLKVFQLIPKNFSFH